jgi:purine-binding chemotaxis protein CheW
MTGQRFDWQAARERLERAVRSLEPGGRRSPEEARRVLEERARSLARLPPETASGDSLDLLVFTRSGERYGLETSRAVEVLPPTSVAPVPGGRAFLAGIVNHRGEVLAVLELRGLIGPAGPGRDGDEPASFVVVVEALGMRFGLRADEVQGVVRIAAEELGPAAPGTGLSSWIRGITDGMVAVVDVEALAADPRLIVDERG